MSKEIACANVVPGCKFTTRSETEAELLQKVAETREERTWRSGSYPGIAIKSEIRGRDKVDMAVQLCSVRVGKPREISVGSESWVTAFYKTQVDDSVYVSGQNLAGDEQADPTVHGGRDKAICAYPAEHYE